MKLDNLTSQVYVVAVNEARLHGHEYVTPEHFVYSTLMFDEGKELMRDGGGRLEAITHELNIYFEEEMPKKITASPMESFSFNQMIDLAAINSRNIGVDRVSVREIILAVLTLNQSHARYILSKNGVDKEKIAQSKQAGGAGQAQPNRPPKPSVNDKNSHISSYTVDLIQEALDNKYDPLVGRQDVLERTIHVLSRRLKNNPVFVGDPGVGKTALVEGLAELIVKDDVPEPLRYANLLRIDLAALVAGTRYRGDFEERLVKLLEAVAALEKPIIAIDEIHTIVGTGAVSSGSMDATSIFKPYLARGDIRFIGSTTHEEYKKHFEKDRALARRFARIDVNEPSEAECVEILKGLKPYYEDYHGVKYPEEALGLIVSLSVKHLNDRFLPDKAIDLLDEAGVYARLNYAKPFTVTPTAIEKVIARTAKVPEKSVGANESTVLKNLGKDLKARIFGQEEAIERITEAIYSSRSGLNEPERPVASLLFLGPTGVGKTEVARQLAELTGIKLTRFDMSEYQEKHAVARLIGSPPGYVGYDEGGLLTEALRRNPHCVLLLDEIEKAHGDILNVLLQVMDYGTLTDNTGRKADFKSAIIIMTSNAGAREMTMRTIGFGSGRDSSAGDKAVEKIFSPEFLNRLDGIVRFNAVDKKIARQIARKALGRLETKLEARGVKLDATKAALDYIAAKGLSETYGAREIIRVVESDVKKLLVNEVLFGKLSKGGECRLRVVGGELVVEV